MNGMIASQIINTCQSIDELKQALGQYDKNTLLETLAYVIESYIINKSSSIPEIQAPVVNNRTDSRGVNASESFVSLISQLKNNFTFPELNCFTVENGRVYVNIENRKVEIRSQSLNTPVELKPELKPQENTIQGETFKRFTNLEIE